MWKKVLYFGVAIVFGILIYIIGYSSNQMNHLEGIVKSAIEKEEFYKVPMVWGGCFDTKSIVENNSDKLDFMIYPATSQTDVTYGPEDNSSRYLEFERAYYIYIFNAKFSIDTATNGASSFNNTALEFSSNDSNSTTYDYYFVVNENMNNSVYVKEPNTKEEVLLNNQREVTNTNKTWNFMRITFTETMLKQISKEIKGNIHKISVKDCDGNTVYSTNINLDFSQDFFANEKISEILTKYNAYLSSYLAANGDSGKLKELNNTWGKEFETWKEEFKAEIPNTGYAIGYERDVVTPGKLVWQTVGMLVLYAVVILLFYVLLFHFSAIKRIFSRENYKDYSRDSKIIVNGKAVSRTKGKPVKEIKAEEVIEPDTSADDTLETVTASEVVLPPIVEETQPNDEVLSNDEPKEESIEPLEDTVQEEKSLTEETPTAEILESAENKVQEENVLIEEAPAVLEEPVVVNETTAKKTAPKAASKKSTTKKSSTPSKPKASAEGKEEPKQPTTKKSTSSKKTSSKSTPVKKSTPKKTESKVEGE